MKWLLIARPASIACPRLTETFNRNWRRQHLSKTSYCRLWGLPKNPTAVVNRGDSLWRITRIIYGDGARYAVVYKANRGTHPQSKSYLPRPDLRPSNEDALKALMNKGLLQPILVALTVGGRGCAGSHQR